MKKTIVFLMIFILISNLFVLSVFASGVYNTDANREAYGSNYYGTSNIREWLNSSEYSVQYSHNPPTAENVNSGQNAYAEEKGFLADGNFTPSERSMLAPRTHRVLLAEIDSNVKDGGSQQHTYNATNISVSIQNYTSSYYKDFTDQVFLLSVKQLNDWVNARGWSYVATPTTQAVLNSEYKTSGLNSSSNWHYWLNTPRSSNSYYVRYASSDGLVSNLYAFRNNIGVRPALNLKSGINKSSGSGTLASPALLGTSGETLNIGDYVRFGQYYGQPITWRVIEKDEQGTVLFAENILTIKPYDATSDGTYPDIANDYDKEFPSEVTDIQTEVGYNWIKVSWNNPVSESLEKISIYKDGIKIHEGSPLKNEFLIEGLSTNTEYEIRLTTGYSSGDESTGISITVKTMEHIEEVQNLFSSVSFDYIYLTWDNPIIEDLQKVIIYQDGIKVGEVIVPDNEFFVEGLMSETEYEIRLTTKYGTGTESEGIKINLTTLAIPYETIKVRNLKAETTYNRVNLSWQNPDITVFDFVRIYRKTEQQEQTAFTDLLFGNKVYANMEEYDPIFETNGTKFNDLTVEEETTYEYMLNSVTTTDEELEGVTIQATTTEAPPPNMGGITETTDENGDYVYTWTSPTEGQAKIYVGGIEYTTVPASDGQVVIPQEDMQYTMSGNPDVQLQPISENGKEGKKSRAGIVGVSLPFSASDLLTSSVGLMAVFGSFILLVLAMRFAPRLVKLLKKSVGKKQEDRRFIP